MAFIIYSPPVADTNVQPVQKYTNSSVSEFRFAFPSASGKVINTSYTEQDYYLPPNYYRVGLLRISRSTENLQSYYTVNTAYYTLESRGSLSASAYSERRQTFSQGTALTGEAESFFGSSQTLRDSEFISYSSTAQYGDYNNVRRSDIRRSLLVTSPSGLATYSTASYTLATIGYSTITGTVTNSQTNAGGIGTNWLAPEHYVLPPVPTATTVHSWVITPPSGSSGTSGFTYVVYSSDTTLLSNSDLGVTDAQRSFTSTSTSGVGTRTSSYSTTRSVNGSSTLKETITTFTSTTQSTWTTTQFTYQPSTTSASKYTTSTTTRDFTQTTTSSSYGNVPTTSFSTFYLYDEPTITSGAVLRSATVYADTYGGRFYVAKDSSLYGYSSENTYTSFSVAPLVPVAITFSQDTYTLTAYSDNIPTESVADVNFKTATQTVTVLTSLTASSDWQTFSVSQFSGTARVSNSVTTTTVESVIAVSGPGNSYSVYLGQYGSTTSTALLPTTYSTAWMSFNGSSFVAVPIAIAGLSVVSGTSYISTKESPLVVYNLSTSTIVDGIYSYSSFFTHSDKQSRVEVQASYKRYYNTTLSLSSYNINLTPLRMAVLPNTQMGWSNTPLLTSYDSDVPFVTSSVARSLVGYGGGTGISTRISSSITTVSQFIPADSKFNLTVRNTYQTTQSSTYQTVVTSLSGSVSKSSEQTKTTTETITLYSSSSLTTMASGTSGSVVLSTSTVASAYYGNNGAWSGDVGFWARLQNGFMVTKESANSTYTQTSYLTPQVVTSSFERGVQTAFASNFWVGFTESAVATPRQISLVTTAHFRGLYPNFPPETQFETFE